VTRTDAHPPDYVLAEFAEGALDDLKWHKAIRESGWQGRVVTAYRPDAVVDPDFEGFSGNLDRLGEMTGEDTGVWQGYLAAHRQRRDEGRFEAPPALGGAIGSGGEILERGPVHLSPYWRKP
jgi:hypothetical protein